MDADLAPVVERISEASEPEDVFKQLTVVLPPRLLAEHLKPEMDEMLGILTPERYSNPEDADAAATARATLEELYAEALHKASRGLYSLDDVSSGPPSRGGTIVVDDVSYVVGSKVHEGTLASLYGGQRNLGQKHARVVIRLANEPSGNAFVQNEIRILNLLHEKDVGYWKGIPFLFGRFRAGERVGLIQRYFSGLTLEELRQNQLHRAGLDQRHVVWVMDRVLAVLGYAHSIGIVHGNITPETVRVRPSNHNTLVTGWGNAVYRPAVTDERVATSGGAYEAPEVGTLGNVGPWTDIFSLGKTLIWLLGGDPVANSIPDSVEPKLKAFILNMVRAHPRARPQSAWKLYEAQNKLKDSLWPRRFIHLDLA
jgi:serine/threonine protein kinase